MTRSNSGSYAVSSYPDPGTAGPAPASPGDEPRGAPAREPASRGQAPLVWAAVVLCLCAIAAFAIPAVGAGHARLFAAGGAVAVVLAAAAVFTLYTRHAADVAWWQQRAAQREQDAASWRKAAAQRDQDIASWREAATQRDRDIASWRSAAEQRQQDAASWKDLAGQYEQDAASWRRRAEEAGQGAGERDARYREINAEAMSRLRHLLDVELPAALDGSEDAPVFAGPSGSSEISGLSALVASAVRDGVARFRKQQEDHSESARRAVLSLARLLQDAAYRTQQEATVMANAYPADAMVLEHTMRVDHAAAQQARSAQSLVVLCDEWPGQQWPEPLDLLDVVRAAAGRIVSFKRVKVSGEPGTAAAAEVVEPLIHVLAELLANAAQLSPPTADVQVTVRNVETGAAIEIEDFGRGMQDAQLDQANRVISGERVVRIGDLGEFPQTGLPVVGRYVLRHGFRAELRRSPYGGVRAIVGVPASLVEDAPAAAPRPEQASPEFLSEATLLPPLPAQSDVPAAGETMTRRLPQRHSRRGLAPQDRPAASERPAEPEQPEQTPEEQGAWLGAYLADDTASQTTADDATETER
jgi:signal transduction histidine kinase